MDIKREADFLRGWSKGKPISPAYPGSGSTFHKCGKWMTQLEPETVAALLESGLAVGTAAQFTVPKVTKACPALTKALDTLLGEVK